VVNHLERGDLRLRRDQAQRLNEWVQAQTLPVIATGHYNFDWSVANGDRNHDAGFDRMVEDDHWAWVRPKTLVKTQCGPNNNRILDFVFVNVSARPFALTSEIIQEANDCGNADVNPDHRPVKAEFDFIGAPANTGPANTGPANTGPTRADLLQRIEALERQILELKALIQRSP
jgi:hypothetical protein